MKRIVECVPNFSEGRRKEVVDALAEALTSERGVALLDVEMDAAHNRCVISIAGEPDAVAGAVIRAAGRAAELIDLRNHRGEHPRMGATDVVPLIPISGITMDECVQLSVFVARQIAENLLIPVYLYEHSARVAERQDLASVRRGEFEGLREEIRTNPERKPDFGPTEVHPSAGATAVGARFPLIAYNVYLNTADIKIAQAIAKAVRFSSGGLRFVKALGFEIKERNQTQVSMNLTHHEGTPIYRVLEMVRREAQRFGVSVVSSEIVGLVPQKALDACADFYLGLENFSPRQVLETRLEEALRSWKEASLEDFLDRVASPDPVPGGGSVAAFAGSLAAALGVMVAGLTEGKKKFEPVEPRVKELHSRLSIARKKLFELVHLDAAAYRAVVEAARLPRGTDQQRETREQALEAATLRATETPLLVAREAAEVLVRLEELARIGNPSARSDVASGAQLAFAAMKAAQYNILINVSDLRDRKIADSFRLEAHALVRQAAETLRKVDALILHAGEVEH